MQSGTRGGDITLEAHFEDGVGDAADALNPRVSIIDPIGGTAVLDAIPTRVSLGIYQYTFAIGAMVMTGVWTASWQGTVDGQNLGPLGDPFIVYPVGAIVPGITGSYTYDPTTDIGYVRLHTDDRDLTMTDLSVPFERRSAIFTDQEIQVFIDDVGGDRNYAVAHALLTIAASRSLLIASRRVGRTQIDFGSVRADLMALAKTFIELANQTPAAGYAEIVYTDFNMRDIIINEQLRATFG